MHQLTVNSLAVTKIKIEIFVQHIDKINKILDKYDKFNYNFYQRVQNGFIKILNKDSNNYMKIDSNLNIADNEKIILDKIKDYRCVEYNLKTDEDKKIGFIAQD